MKIMLRENMESLGKKGDIITVAQGYGRNYLLPKKMAVEVTPTNWKLIEIEQRALKKGLEKEMSSYQEEVDKLNLVRLSFSRKAGEKDALFGSVTATDIKEAMDQQGYDIEKKKIQLAEPIKRLGNYTISIKVFHEQRAEIQVEVIKEGESEEAPAAKAMSPETTGEAAPEEAPEIGEDTDPVETKSKPDDETETPSSVEE